MFISWPSPATSFPTQVPLCDQGKMPNRWPLLPPRPKLCFFLGHVGQEPKPVFLPAPAPSPGLRGEECGIERGEHMLRFTKEICCQSGTRSQASALHPVELDLRCGTHPPHFWESPLFLGMQESLRDILSELGWSTEAILSCHDWHMRFFCKALHSTFLLECI